MGKVKELSVIADEIRSCGQNLLDIAESLAELFGGKQAELEITLEEVRAVLAQKSADGFTDKIRELLKKHGADKLSAVDPANYAALMVDAEGLT